MLRSQLVGNEGRSEAAVILNKEAADKPNLCCGVWIGDALHASKSTKLSTELKANYR